MPRDLAIRPSLRVPSLRPKRTERPVSRGIAATVTTDFSPGEVQLLREIESMQEGHKRLEELASDLYDLEKRVLEGVTSVRKDLKAMTQAQGLPTSPLARQAKDLLRPESPRGDGRDVAIEAVAKPSRPSGVASPGPGRKNSQSNLVEVQVLDKLQDAQNFGSSDDEPIPEERSRGLALLGMDLYHTMSAQSVASMASSMNCSSTVNGNSGQLLVPTLPVSWPESVEFRYSSDLHDDSFNAVVHGSEMPRKSSVSSGNNTNETRMMSLQRQSPSGTYNYLNFSAEGGFRVFFRDNLAINPNCVSRIIYDLFSLLVLFYDLTVIPYMLAWDVPFEGVFDFLAWFTVCFWTLDIFMNFATGFHWKGLVVMDPVAISRRYFKTWMLPDIAIVGCDWLSTILTKILERTASAGGVKILRVAKLTRLVRILGVLRVIKFFMVVEDFVDRNLSETHRLALRILSLFCGMAWMNHLMCCAWFFIGSKAPSDTIDDRRWTVQGLQYDFDLDGPLYQYVTTFHWSISQITLGSIDIPCMNSLERIFNILCLMMGLLFGSTLVSSLSATMVEYQMMRKERVQKLRMLRQFLRDNQVDLNVARLVQNQVRERLGEKDKLTDKDVPVLGLLSSSLRSQLRLEIFRRYLYTHPLFRLWGAVDINMMKRICVSCLDFLFLRPLDDLFVPGPAQDEAYYIVQGSMVYMQNPDSCPVIAEMETKVDEDRWLSEAALWCHWFHVGTAESFTSCQLMVMRSSAVGEVLQMRHSIRGVTVEYAKQFHKRVVSACPPAAEYPTDLSVPFAEYGDLVASMSRELQTAIGLWALEHNASKNWRSGQARTGFTKLKMEIESGKSVVMTNASGEVERVVSVIALRVEKRDRTLLVQLGKMEEHTPLEAAAPPELRMVPTMNLPGAKQERGEVASEAVQRITEAKLPPLTGCIEVTSTNRTVEWKESKEFGVRTKYLRTECATRLSESSFQPPANQVTTDLREILLARKRHSFGEDYNMSRVISTAHQAANAAADAMHVAADAISAGLGHEASDTGNDELGRVRSVFGVEEKGKIALYGWLLPEEFESLRGGEVEERDMIAWLWRLQEQVEERTRHGCGSVSVSSEIIGYGRGEDAHNLRYI